MLEIERVRGMGRFGCWVGVRSVRVTQSCLRTQPPAAPYTFPAGLSCCSQLITVLASQPAIQTLMKHVLRIAAEYTGGDKEEWQRAAKKFRLPYLDWWAGREDMGLTFMKPSCSRGCLLAWMADACATHHSLHHPCRRSSLGRLPHPSPKPHHHPSPTLSLLAGLPTT